MGILRTDPYARSVMVRLDLDQFRFGLPALFNGVRTARMETASARRIDRGGYVAGQDYPFPLRLDLRIGHGDRRNQRLRVRMKRLRIHLFAVGKFDYLPEVHDGYPVRDVADRPEIVRNE